MAEVIRMPKLSDTMTDGVVACWNKKLAIQSSEEKFLQRLKRIKPQWNSSLFQWNIIIYWH